mgnify:CR=1 FL=1|jgi:hypothetical protein
MVEKLEDSTPEKLRRYFSFIYNNGGKSFRLTPMAKSINVKVGTLRNFLNLHRNFMDMGDIEIFDDENKNILLIRIAKERDEYTFKREVVNRLLSLEKSINKLNKDTNKKNGKKKRKTNNKKLSKK